MNVELPFIEVVGKRINHNTSAWRVATNRHSNSNGTSWGWIEGAPGNVFWSNDSAFNISAAGEAVKLHNEWLDDQRPALVKLIEATERQRRAAARFENAKAAYEKASADLEAIDVEVAALSMQVAQQVAA